MEQNREKLIEAYVGVKNDPVKTEKTLNWYKDSFEKGDVSGGFSWKWSWGAFFGNWLYLLYRKCYVEGISYFLLIHLLGGILAKYFPELNKFTEGSGLFISLLAGGLLHNLVYRRYLKTKITLSQKNPQNISIEDMKEYGGTDKRAVKIGILVYIIVNILFNI